jgi:HAMP domain-containing protein
MSRLLAACTASLFALSSGYLLGEGPDDPLFQRCWQNGNLLAKCPEGITVSWNFSSTEEWIDSSQYDLKVDVEWTEEFSANVVHWEGGLLLPHINVHSCKFELGKVCIPFIAADGSSVSHTSVITSDEAGSFDSHVVLTNGAWNVIAHARAYLNDSTFYPLEGDTDCSSHDGLPSPFPWKLDVAIGQSHDVLPKPLIDTATSVEGWKVFMFALALMLSFFIFYKLYKQCQKNQVEELERLSPQKQLRKSLIFELATILISWGLGLFDFITDALALATIQKNRDITSFIVVIYFALIIVVSVFFAIVCFNTMRSIMTVLHEFRNGLVDVTMKKEKNIVQINPAKTNPNESDEENQEIGELKQEFESLVQKGDIAQQYTKIQRSIGGEKMSLLMTVMEDIPMIIFNSILIFSFEIRSSQIFISFVVNALMLGYKVSGVQRLWLNMQLKRKLDQMVGAIQFSREATHFNDPKHIYAKLIDIGKELTSI